MGKYPRRGNCCPNINIVLLKLKTSQQSIAADTTVLSSIISQNNYEDPTLTIHTTSQFLLGTILPPPHNPNNNDQLDK